MYKKLHLTCKDKNKINNKTWIKCINKYKELYSDYEIIIYDNNDIYNIVEKHFPQYLEDIKQIKIGAVLADIFRYLILYLEGGIYSDMDCEPLIKIDTLLNKNMTFFCGDKNRDNNFFIYPTNIKNINNKWDFYTDHCHNNCLLSTDKIKTYKCLGHNYIDELTDVIVCYEFYPNQICQWFIIAKSKQKVFLDCFNECMQNIKTLQTLNKYSVNYINLVMKNCGPELFTKNVFNNINTSNICILPDVFFCCGSGRYGRKAPKNSNSYIKHHFTGSWKLF